MSGRAILGLRGRLLAVFLTMMLIAAIASTAVVSHLLAVRARDSLDRYLERQARDFVAAARGVTEPAALPKFAGDFFKTAEHNPNELILLVHTRDGQTVSTLPSLGLEQLPEVQVLLAKESGAATISTPKGHARILAYPVPVAGGPAGTYVLARFTDALDRNRAEIVRLFLLVLLSMLGVAGAAGYLLTGKALEPIGRITRAARLISREDLSRRITQRGPDDEIGELVATFNEMLGRLEAAFAEQQRFLSDVSHELRTPMQVIKGHLEVLQRLPDPSQQEYQETLTLVLDEVDRMARLVAQLLTLARSSGALAQQRIELKGFLQEFLRKAETLAPRRFSVDVEGAMTVAADRNALTQILLNLVQNAVDNTRAADHIIIGARAAGPEVRLWVQDTGRGIPPEAIPHLFERFYRVGENGTAGLGLAIVDALVRAHGGRVGVNSEPGKGTAFEVLLPTA